MSAPTIVEWTEEARTYAAQWRSESGAPPPRQISVVDDRITADEAYGLAGQGVGLLWRGDYQNARQLLTALANRAERVPRKAKQSPPAVKELSSDAFNLHRQAQAQRARTLGRLLIPLEQDYEIRLRRAPDVREACLEAYGPADAPSLVSLRELLGLVGAHEWRRKGIPIAAVGGRIHPHYGVFTPIRKEYVELVSTAPLPPAAMSGTAFDIGTGTGVLAAVLARRGVPRVAATDLDPRAIACARENIERLGLGRHVEVMEADMFPEGRADLIVCNPPWVPARPSSPIERGIFDPESRMLLGFLDGLASHLTPAGEGWLILSDLAEHLRLRTREQLLAAIAAAALSVVGRIEAKPSHPRALDATDPLHAARAAEVTSLWRLRAG